MVKLLSNHYTRMTILNLGESKHERGPFLVTQDAVGPNDPSQRERTWLLRHDGRWIDLIANMSLPESERYEAWYQTLAEAMQVINNLPPKPVVHDVPVDADAARKAQVRLEALDLAQFKRRATEWLNAQGNQAE